MGKKTYQSFLKNYYLSSSLYDFIFAYAIYNVLFSIRGLSVFQISLLLSFWALTAMIFEIPSGALADYWSRKKMLIIAPLMKSICFFIWFLANGNFYLYGLGFIFWSLGSSFVSGTSEALLYDNLVFFKKKNTYEKILGRKKFYHHIAIAISVIAGGIMAYYNLDFAIIFSIIPLFLSSLFASFMPESPKVESTEEIHYLAYIKLAFNEVKKNKILRILLIYVFCISIFGDIEEFDQLYYEFVHLPIFMFGIAGFAYSFLNAIGSFYAHKFKNINWILYTLPAIAASFLFFIGLFPSIPMILVLLLSYFITSPLHVIVNGKIQHNIQSIGRATVTSVTELFINLFSVILTLIFGYLGKIWDLRAIYISSGLFLLLFSSWVIFQKKIFKLTK